MENLKDKILNLFNEKNYNPQNIDEIYEALKLTETSDFTLLAKSLNSLEDEFVITHNKKGQFALLKTFSLAYGKVDVKDGGFAFVDTDEGGIFVKASDLQTAVQNDLVMIKVSVDSKGRLEGRVVRIIERANPFIYGELMPRRGKFMVQSIDAKIKLYVFIKQEDSLNARPHQMVKVKINKYYDNQTADGEVVEVLGFAKESGLDISSLVLTSGVPTAFSKEVEQELESIPDEIDKSKYPDRVDLTDKLIVTIDGDDAKDFDDAINVTMLDNGNYLLGVYIADVTHYIKENTFLDLEANERGTSIYLPDRVIPMLPFKISNGICSLNEGVDRLVMCCEMEFDTEGNLVNHDIFEGIINSKRRLTYNIVNNILEGNNDLMVKYSDVYEMLNSAYKLSTILYDKRIKRGAFEFETSEPKLIMDQNGRVRDIVLRERGKSECLIEEFMLAANETVAESMTWLDVPFIYRVHEEPKDEKIVNLLETLNAFGYQYKLKNKKSLPSFLQKVLHDNIIEAGLSEDETTRREIINKILVRSMSKAKYQELNIGHFGLASKCYTHFTSPIRRYPDLLVHRLIKQFMLNKPQALASNPVSFYEKKVFEVGVSASKAERVAETLERDTTEYKECEYMERFLGERLKGIISSITNFGVFITLDNTVEGLARFDEMHDDYYEVDQVRGFIEGTKYHIRYSLGDKVIVRLMGTDKSKRQITFKLLRKA